ncbi:DUF996 domain-containing protein [Hydrogenobaculum acidophilum]
MNTIDLSHVKKNGTIGGILLTTSIIPFIGIIGFFSGLLFIAKAVVELSNAIKDRLIYKKFMAGFMPNIILAIGLLIFEIFFGVGYLIAKNLKAQGSPTVFFLLISIMVFLLGYILGIIVAYHYKLAFNKIYDATKDIYFKKAGEIMFLGSLLAIVGIGIVLVYISYIFILKAFIDLPKNIKA